jgi:hypothetical protein
MDAQRQDRPESSPARHAEHAIPEPQPAPRVRAVARRLAPSAPIVVVAMWLLLMAFAYFTEQRYYTKPSWQAVAAFADIGTISGQHLGLDALVMDHNPTGFDGQFFYFEALDPRQPLLCAHHPPNCALDWAFGEVRAERILYPYTAFVVSLGGQSHLVPYALLAVNFVAVLVVTGLVGVLAVEAGASRWLGAAAGLFCGEVQGFLRDLADPYAVLWLVVAAYCLRKAHYSAAALALAAALLTREQLILTVPLLALPLVVERRWRTLAESAAVTLGPFVVWQVVLRLVWGRWALATGDTAGAGVDKYFLPLPFHGLWVERQQPQFGMMVAFVVVPLIFACVLSLLAIWRRYQAGGWRAALLDPLPVFILVYALELSLTSWILWQDMWTPSRLAAEVAVLGVIVAARYASPTTRVAYGAVAALTGMAALMLLV